MNPAEIIDLLSAIAAYDQRTVGQSDVEAWLDIAEDEGWTYPLARRAVREYHRRGAAKPRITPAAVTDTIAAARRTVRDRLLRTDITPPRELADNPAAEIAWRREYTSRATDSALDQWAATGTYPDPLPPTAALAVVPVEKLDARVQTVIEAFEERSRKALR